MRGPEQVPSSNDSPEAPDRYFQAYLEGNARFPTFAFPFVLLLAHEAIFDLNFDPVSFARSHLSDRHLNKLKEKIAAQHAFRGIPVAPVGHEDRVRKAVAEKHGRTPEDIEIRVLPDDYFQFVWRSYVNHAIAMIGALAGIRHDLAKWSADYPFMYNHRFDKVVSDEKLIPLATEVAKRLQDENVRMEVQNVFRSFAKTMNGPHGRKRSDEIREVLDYSERGLPLDDQRYRADERKIRELNQQLFKAMVGEYILSRDSDVALGLKPPILTEQEFEAFRRTFVHP